MHEPNVRVEKLDNDGIDGGLASIAVNTAFVITVTSTGVVVVIGAVLGVVLNRFGPEIFFKIIDCKRGPIFHCIVSPVFPETFKGEDSFLERI